MRDAFIRELHDLATTDPDVLLLTSDIGYAVFDKYRESFPDRFVNFGIAEANMIGVAAGMALSGKKPFAYTIIPFLTMRAFEQIRVDLCIQNQPVVLIGVGGGLAYGVLGPTHHALEDVAILRALPNMTVITPSDPIEAQKAVRAAYDNNGPVYIRLGKNGEPDLEDYGQYEIGKGVLARQGDDATIVSAGPLLRIAIEAADLLKDKGIGCRVINMHTIKPIDRDIIVEAAKQTDAMIAFEEHSIIGGLGSAVSEVIAESGVALPFKRIGTMDQFSLDVGEQSFQWEKQNLTTENICSTMIDLLG